MEQVGWQWKDFREILYLAPFIKICRLNWKFCENWANITGTLSRVLLISG
jgi:hypothetical protein